MTTIITIFTRTRFTYSKDVYAAYSISILLNVNCLDYRLINESSDNRNIKNFDIGILD